MSEKGTVSDRKVSDAQIGQHEDMQLVLEVKKGNRNAFSDLVRKHQKSLLRLCMRFVKDVNSAQDIAQDTFIKAFEKIDSFEGRSSFKSWLFQIGVNTAKNKLRDHFSKASSIDDMEFSTPPKAEMALVENVVGQMLRAEVDRLPFKQKTALVLRVYEDMSFAEIAAIMECPYDTAKANYRHALLKLKDVFSAHADFRKIAFESINTIGDINQRLMEAE
jgi:RNA polymerase sigma-70 factor, ECF subfamily